MELDQATYLAELERFGHELTPGQRRLMLATTFQKSVGNPFAAQQKARKGKAKQQGAGAANWNEVAHPRDATGRFIEAGSSGPAVKAIQGILDIETDGEFGKRTTAAVRRFQRENGLQVDGVIGQQTAAALLGNEKASSIDPGALRPGQASRLRKAVSGDDGDDGDASASGAGHKHDDDDGIGEKMRAGRPIRSRAEDTLPKQTTDRLAKAGWDYHSGYWWPPGHAKNDRS